MDLRIPVAAKTLLDFIIKTETGTTGAAAYNTLFGHNERRWTPALTNMTIDEAIAAGRTWTKRWKSSAAGGPQFMRNTLIALKDDLGLTGKERMSPELQDFMGYALLKRRGFRSFLNGTVSRTEFGKRLAQEWASFPVLAACTGAHRKLKRGQSYYAGDGLNHSLITPAQVESVLDDVLRIAKLEKKPVEPPPAPEAPEPGEDVQRVPAPPPEGEEAAKPADPPKPKKLRWSKRLWTWLTTGGAGGLLGAREIGLFHDLDWTFWAILAGLIVAMSLIGILTMPELRAKLGRAVRDA